MIISHNIKIQILHYNIININVHNSSQNACRSSDGVGVKVCKMIQVTSSQDPGPLSSLIHFRSSLSPRQGLLTGDGGSHHPAEVVNDVGCMVDVARKEGLICLLCPAIQWPSPTLGAKCVTVVQSTVPSYTGEFNQWPMLGLASWEYMQGVIYQQMTQRGATANFCNIY